MSIAGLILGFIDVGIVVAALLLFGAIAVWILAGMGYPPPAEVRKVYLLLVALVALGMLAALLLGMPPLRLIGPVR